MVFPSTQRHVICVDFITILDLIRHLIASHKLLLNEVAVLIKYLDDEAHGDLVEVNCSCHFEVPSEWCCCCQKERQVTRRWRTISVSEKLNTYMERKQYADWLGRRDQVEMFLLEVSNEFPRHEYNQLFDSQLDQLARSVHEPAAGQQLDRMYGLDWVGYIARSLRNGGFKDADIDPMTHEVVVRLLLKPGKLFRGWNGQAPMEARFKLAVRNAVLNLRAKRTTRQRRIPSVSVHQPGTAIPTHQPYSDELIDAFRDFLRDRHGEAAVEVLNQRLRLANADTKDLVGRPGLESAYKVKKVVQAIKQAAREFAADDPQFLAMIERAMQDETRTLQKRFAAVAD